MKWKNIELSYKNNLANLKRKSCFELLEIDNNASFREAKLAYKAKVLLYHPDRTDPFMSAYSEEVIKLLNQAINEIKELRKNEQ